MNFSLPEGIAVLERTPQALEDLLTGLPPSWTAANEGAGTWSPFDVVGHLIDCEETNWMPRLDVILLQDPDRGFEPFDRLRHLDRNKGRMLGDLLSEFRRLREGSLRDLRARNLTSQMLALTGKHPEFGTVALSQLLATWVVHDLGHIAQITRVMAKQYREAVGPWEAYLPVLHRGGESGQR